MPPSSRKRRIILDYDSDTSDEAPAVAELRQSLPPSIDSTGREVGSEGAQGTLDCSSPPPPPPPTPPPPPPISSEPVQSVPQPAPYLPYGFVPPPVFPPLPTVPPPRQPTGLTLEAVAQSLLETVQLVGSLEKQLAAQTGQLQQAGQRISQLEQTVQMVPSAQQKQTDR